MADCAVHFPLYFLAREAVRSFIMEMMQGFCDEGNARAHAFLLYMDFAAQGVQWRALKKAWPGGVVDWDNEPMSRLLAFAAGYTGDPASFMRVALDSGFLVLEHREDVVGIACPIFTEFNAHLLPGFIPFHRKGQIAALEKRQRANDPEFARQQRLVFEQQEKLNLGDFSADTTPEEIEAAIVLVMQMDRAGGMPVRASSGYSSWMLAAVMRLAREQSPVQIERLIAFLIDARQDPTVPKGAEAIIQHLPKLLERSAY